MIYLLIFFGASERNVIEDDISGCRGGEDERKKRGLHVESRDRKLPTLLARNLNKK
jgi:hypothetical protein